jgi:hypothetical protein
VFFVFKLARQLLYPTEGGVYWGRLALGKQQMVDAWTIWNVLERMQHVSHQRKYKNSI